MIKIFQDKRRDVSFALRIQIVFWAAVVLTYIFLWISLQYGSIGLFFGGVISGGLWGEVWHMFFQQSPQQKLLPKNSLFYVIAIFLMMGSLIYLIIFYPLPSL